MPEDTQKEELTFGQVAILQGYTTPERVRECLEIQEKIRSIGGKPRLLGDILYEKGYLTAEQINRIFQVQQAYQNQAKGILNIPGYEILSKIGQGGMGAVYRARQISMDRAVALKVLPPRLARDRQFVDRFLNEARAVARLRHENIILGIDAGEANGLYYFVMEFVEGETVQGILRRDGRLDEKRALKIAQQIAAALQHAFDNRMVHRDIKPSNILITREGTAKLCDLGLAKVQHRGDAGNTQTGMAVGTPHYISPEQARGESEVDIRSDIYSLGASIYHMVTGEVPFTGPNAAVVMSKHVTTPPTPPREKNGSLSSAVNDLILKCMSKHREHRFQTPADLIAEIRKVLDAATAAPPRRPEPARPAVAASLPPPPSLRRHTQKRSPVPGLIALGMAAVAGIIVLQLLPPSRTTVPVPPTRIPGGSSGNAPGGSGGVTPVPGRTEADTRLQQLQGEIQAVLADGARLRELPALHARLEAFAKSTAGTALADAAAALLDDYRGKVNAKSDEAWRAAREAADEPLRAGRLAAALDRYRAFPTELRAFNPGAEKPEPLMTTRGGREVDSAVRDLQFRIRSSYLTHVQEIEQSLGRNDLRRAWTAGLAMVPYTSEDLLKESDPELRALPEKRDERLLGILTHEIDALCKASKFAEARARCDELQKNEDLPASVRQKAAQTGLDLGRRETEWRQGLRQFLWTAYQAELGGPVRKALESRDIETGKQALTAFLFRRLEERKTFLWLPEIDYPKLVQPALAPAPLTADALALLVIAIGKALGTANPDVTQDAARAALLDLRAVLLFDDLLRQADAGARAFASTGEAVTLVSSQALDRSFFPGARCQIVLDKGTEFFFLPYGKAAPRIGFSLGKGTAQPLLEDDVIALASRTWDAVAKRWKPVPADPIQRFKYGLLLYHGGKKEKQKQSATELEAARAGGVPALDRYLGGGAGTAAPPPSAGTPPAAPAAGGSRAQDFQDQLDLVRDLVRKAADKKTTWAFARKELNDLTAEFGGDPTFADKKAEIEALRAQIEAGLKPK